MWKIPIDDSVTRGWKNDEVCARRRFIVSQIFDEKSTKFSIAKLISEHYILILCTANAMYTGEARDGPRVPWHSGIR